MYGGFCFQVHKDVLTTLLGKPCYRKVSVRWELKEPWFVGKYKKEEEEEEEAMWYLQ